MFFVLLRFPVVRRIKACVLGGHLEGGPFKTFVSLMFSFGKVTHRFIRWAQTAINENDLSRDVCLLLCLWIYFSALLISIGTALSKLQPVCTYHVVCCFFCLNITFITSISVNIMFPCIRSPHACLKGILPYFCVTVSYKPVGHMGFCISIVMNYVFRIKKYIESSRDCFEMLINISL